MSPLAEQLLAQAGGKLVVSAAMPTPAKTPRRSRPVRPVARVIASPAGKPPEKLSLTRAAKETGTSRDTLYRLYKAGFLKGWMPSPKKIILDAADLREFLAVSAQSGFWTPERKARYNGKAAAQ